MTLYSFIDQNDSLVEVEVEIRLWPGLSDIHFLGMADSHLKESTKRIKSALRAQGFEFPPTQQVLVNLRPSYLKKSSKGLDLAVAIGFLCESGQIPREKIESFTHFYGELSLNGEVLIPEDFEQVRVSQAAKILTGFSSQTFSFPSYSLKSLNSFSEVSLKPPGVSQTEFSPDEQILSLEISKDWGDQLAILALGSHSVLMAGQAGAGKTTATQILHALMPEPDVAEKRAIEKNAVVGAKNLWRPWVQPHSSIPLKSLIGGSSTLHGGELARADLGVLVLDELLEFSPPTLEALRGPLETKVWRVQRGGHEKSFPLRAQILATTNLCPCGQYIPGQPQTRKCALTLSKCRSYLNRFSGPLIDRFEVLTFVEKPRLNTEKTQVRELKEKLDKIRNKGGASGVEEFEKSLSPVAASLLESRPFSARRRKAFLRVAQSISRWHGQASPSLKDCEQAFLWTVANFDKISRWD